jgi:hypothetical protein
LERYSKKSPAEKLENFNKYCIIKSMAINNLMVELMVPRDPSTTKQITDFYSAIGWQTWPDSHEGDNARYVSPAPETPTTIMYWQTMTPEKTDHFVGEAGNFHLPVVNKLVEVVFVMSSTDAVEDVWNRGGKVLQSRAYKPLEPYYGGLDMRFADPFNYALRVTTNPGYELS